MGHHYLAQLMILAQHQYINYATLEPNLLRMIVQYAGEMLINTADSMGNTPLHHSIKYECTDYIVEAPGCDVNLDTNRHLSLQHVNMVTVLWFNYWLKCVALIFVTIRVILLCM